MSRLNDILVKAVKSAEIAETLTKLGAHPLGTTPEETRGFVRRELGVWAKAVQESGARFE